jgi:hypothetical protein
VLLQISVSTWKEQCIVITEDSVYHFIFVSTPGSHRTSHALVSPTSFYKLDTHHLVILDVLSTTHKLLVHSSENLVRMLGTLRFT